MLGITLRGGFGIGNQFRFAPFPENYYRNTGENVIDLDCAWIFDHNPFVARGVAPTRIVNLWAEPWPERSGPVPLRKFLAKPVFSSIAERTAGIFNRVTYLRHPRTYAYEELPRICSRVVIHITGKPGKSGVLGEDEERVMSEEIIECIGKKYSSCDLIQIGLRQDVDAHVTDCRGLENIWDRVGIIAQAAVFIGVDSGPSWIAACYPGVFTKEVLMQYPPEFLRSGFIAMDLLTPHRHRQDASFFYYNRSKDDAGITYSYLKI